VTIRLYITAARCPPRSEPHNSHDLRPRAIPLSARSAALLLMQIQLSFIGTSDSPALAFFNGALQMAWKGIKNDTGIWTATL
jgi:hypothetical protein